MSSTSVFSVVLVVVFFIFLIRIFIVHCFEDVSRPSRCDSEEYYVDEFMEEKKQRNKSSRTTLGPFKETNTVEAQL